MATAKVVGIAAAPLEAAVDQVCRQVNHEASSPVELVHCAPALGGGAAKQLRWLRQYKCLCDELLPALRERPHAQVLHISSGEGELLYLSPALQRQMAAVDSERALLRLLAAARPLRNA